MKNTPDTNPDNTNPTPDDNAFMNGYGGGNAGNNTYAPTPDDVNNSTSGENNSLDEGESGEKTPPHNSKYATVEVNGKSVNMPKDWLENGEFDGQKLADIALSLRKSLGKKQDLQAPENQVPENYEMSETLQDLGKPLGMTADNTVVQGFMDSAKELGLSQDQFNGLFESYAKNLSTQIEQTGVEASTVTHKNLQEYFGDDYEVKLAGLGKTYENLLGADLKETHPDAWETLLDLSSTSGGLILLDRLHNSISTNKPPTQKGTTHQTDTVTKSDLDAMISDPKYKTDKAFQEKTKKAFEQFYREK